MNAPQRNGLSVNSQLVYGGRHSSVQIKGTHSSAVSG